MNSRNCNPLTITLAFWLVSTIYWAIVAVVFVIWLVKANDSDDYATKPALPSSLGNLPSPAIESNEKPIDAQQASDVKPQSQLERSPTTRVPESVNKVSEVVVPEPPPNETNALPVDLSEESDEVPKTEQPSLNFAEEEVMEDTPPPEPNASLRQSLVPSIRYPDGGIEAGKTAPHYLLEDQQSVESLLYHYGGLFVVTNGKLGYDIGSDLSRPRRKPISINEDGTWYKIYAKRIARIPASWGFEQVIGDLTDIDSQLEDASIVLAVPVSVDKMIYDAQSRFFEGEMDVTATTIIQVRDNKIEVLGIVK